MSSNKKVFIDELASDIDKIEDKLSLLQRKLDRSLRNTNLENFNQNGTIRKGRGVKLVWKKSKRCHNIQKQIKELYRIQRVKRKLSHINLANSLLELGDVFNVENNPISAWAVRSKETKVRKDGRIQSKKRFGKSIANHAPSMFVTILENKVKSLGGYLNKIDIKNAASQYDFTNGLKTKHELKERNVTLSNNNVHLRDTIAAFNIQHFDSNKLEYDVDNMKRDYEIFVKLEKEEIDRHKHLSVKKIQSLIQNLNNKTVIFYNSKGKLLQYVINNKVVDIIQNGNTGIYTVIENNKVVNKLFSINQYGHIKEKVIDNVYPYTYNGKLIILYKDDRLHFIDSETLNEIVSFETNGLDNNQILSTNGGILTFNNRILQILNTK